SGEAAVATRSGSRHCPRRARVDADDRAPRRTRCHGRVRLGRRRAHGPGGYDASARRRLMVSGASMMTPYSFERLYEEDWRELETLLERLRTTAARRSSPVPGARFAALYRRTCEHLALARARA